ncbi:hypothetical protein [Litchfieldia alkalitelluris]|uniref:hypothetical protein n=1 Tax=Litchfieldia alkalitelluris TaxID=304268 RepID=UPI000998530C|nr:hypothetical protein [Litchfieldia alkalitelluris]
MGNREWKVSKEEYQKLLKFLGYGNFREADLVIFGNEEGAGGYSIEANVKARCESYGKDPNGNYINCLEENDWTGGYWDLEENGQQKILKHLLPSEKAQKEGYTRGAFLPAVARICLGLENKNEDVEAWFKSYADNGDAAKDIKRYIRETLFKKNDKIQSALVDWRPLPRQTESIWYPVEYGEISPTRTNNPYLRAFNKPKVSRTANSNSFSNFNQDVESRASTIHALFKTIPSKVIIGFGGANGIKKEVFEKIFGENIFEPLEFKTVDVSYLNSYKAKVSVGEKDIHIFLLPFPEIGTVFKSHDDQLKCLKELTVSYVAPLVG